MSATWREAIAPEKDVIAPSCRRPGGGRTPISAARLDPRLPQPKRHCPVALQRPPAASVGPRLTAFPRAPAELAQAAGAGGGEPAPAARLGAPQPAGAV